MEKIINKEKSLFTSLRMLAILSKHWSSSFKSSLEQLCRDLLQSLVQLCYWHSPCTWGHSRYSCMLSVAWARWTFICRLQNALDGPHSLWHQLSDQCGRAQREGVKREEIISKFLLESLHTVQFGKDSLYIGKLARNCLTPAGTEMLITTFTDIACCTFRDRQIACEFFNCCKKSGSPVLFQTQIS